MKCSLTKMQRIASAGLLAAAACWAGAASERMPRREESSQQIFDVMIRLPGSNPATGEHAKVSYARDVHTLETRGSPVKAAHFQGGSIPVTVRFFRVHRPFRSR